MKRKSTLILILIVGMSMIISCVSPYYGTARIPPGWDANAGVALNSYYLVPICGSISYELGLRGDIEVSYGIARILRPYLRLGGGVSLGGGFIDPGAGLQLSVPTGNVTPSVIAEVNLQLGEPTIAPAVLIGVGGEEEKLTLGARTECSIDSPGDQFYVPWEVFATYHHNPRLAVFCGVELRTLIGTFTDNGYPLITLGVGYNYTR